MVNKFTNGLNIDAPDYHLRDDNYSYALNTSLITNDNNENILQNNKGNVYAGTLPEGYILIGEKDYNGVCYLISYNPTTNRGQIGSYPSPSYTNQVINDNGNLESNLELNYKPLKNYRNDNVTPDYTNTSDFDTELFNFSLENPLKVEIQPDYDGSVNIIFTDNKNPIRIVNSYFGLLPNNRYELIERKGLKKDNLYNRNNFSNTLNLILRSNIILNLNFNGIGNGQLKAGNYIYYFRYLTSSGNYTDIIEQSSTVSIFFGDKVANIRSGLENEPTSKSAKFTLSNLDESFSYVQVSFSYTSQNNTLYYTIENLYQIKNNSLTFEHTGIENVLPITSEQLIEKFSNFVTAKSIAQTQNRLFVANTKSLNYNFDLFKNFAESVTLEEDSFPLDIVLGKGSDFYTSALNYVNNQFNNGAINNWNMAYHNPMNIYYNSGYWRGEAYSFGIVFILKDGSLTNVFPVRGYDNLNNNAVYQNLNLNNNNDFDLTYGENIRGVYRFKQRFYDSFLDSSNDNVDVKFIRYKFPNVPQSIKDNSLGCFFVRSNKIENIVTQGYITNCFKLKKVSTGSYRYTDDWIDVNGSYKVIPLIGGITEASEVNNNDYSPNQAKVVAPIQIVKELDAGETVDYLRYGFYSPDYYLNNSNLSQSLDNKVYVFNNFSKVTFNTNYLKSFPFPDSPNINVAGLYYPTSIDNRLQNDIINLYSYNTPRTTTEFNAGLFTSQFDTSLVLSTSNIAFNEDYFKCSSLYDDYVGFLFDRDFGQKNNSELLNYFSVNRIASKLYDENNVSNIPLMFNGNVLNSNGYRSTSDVFNIYVTDNLTYTPISKRYYWSEIENNLNFPVLRGDCFIGLFIKNQFTNRDDDTDSLYQQKIGKSFGILVESSINISLRNNEFLNVSEGVERTFLPYNTTSTTVSYSDLYNTFRDNIYRIPESKFTLKGLSKTFTDDILLALSTSIPYYFNNFDTRIYVSNLHINNGLVNGYRVFSGFNYKDYVKKYGSITEIIVSNNRFLMIQENSVNILPISERIVTAQTLTNAVITQNGDVLPSQDNTRVISDVYGSRWQFSVKNSNNTIYGVDVEKNKVWRVIDTRLELISDFIVQSYIKQYTDSYNSMKNNVTEIDVKTHFNRYANDLIFTFYNKNLSQDTFSLTYNESINRWTTFNSWIPYFTFSYYDKFFSLNYLKDFNKFYEHNLIPYTVYYDNIEDFVIEFVINENLSIQKVLDNLQLVSNKIYPYKIEYNTDNDINVIQVLVPRVEGNLLISNIEYRENHHYINVNKNSTKRIRDKYIRVKIFWKTSDNVIISHIVSILRNSFS